MARRDLIVIGASAGGIEAVSAILAELPPDLRASILVVIHQYARGPNLLHQVLGRQSALRVVPALDGEPLVTGVVVVAGPDRHLLVEPGHYRSVLGPHENRHRPAVDPLFRTAAAAYGARVVAVILTGNLDDGAAGIAAVKRAGGTTVVQEPEDAAYPGMPTAALRAVSADHVAPLAEVAALLVRLVAEPTADTEDPPMTPSFPSGQLARVSCPTCHGSMVEIPQNGVTQYRCHIGHVFSPETLLAEQILDAERSLDMAQRGFEEAAFVARQLLTALAAEVTEEASRRASEVDELERRVNALKRLAQG